MENEATLEPTEKPVLKETPPVERELALPADSAQLRLKLEVPAGTRLEVDVEAHTPDGTVVGQHSFVLGDGIAAAPTAVDHRTKTASRAAFWGWLAAVRWSTWLFGAALGVYLITRLVGLPDFPIYFFTDEAVQTVLAADLLRDHLMSYEQELLPTFFKNGPQYNLGLSVYLQTLPYWFLGKSIWVTRGTAALVTVLAAVSAGLTLKNIFRSPYPWLGVLCLSIIPAWFLHSRTAFETTLATTCYAAFLYFYLMYRCQHPRYLYGAVIAAALTFYAYSPARAVIAVAAGLLFLSDIKYHWKQRGTVLKGLGLTLLLALPFFRFLYNHPDESIWHMRMLRSYWVSDISMIEKLRLYAQEYLRGLDPFYWYLSHGKDLARHTMPGYGHLLKQTLPLGLLGVGLAIYNFRSPAYRAVLAAMLAAPAGGALVAVGITRVMFMMIPAALLTALAISWLLEQARRRWALSRVWLVVPVFLLLAGVNLFMLRDALVNGPTWYKDYGLNGVQYGARQLFGEIDRYLKANPGVKLIVSPAWANGTDVVARFFFDDPLPFTIGNADGYYSQVLDLDENTVFVLIPDEYEAIPREKFAEVRVEQTLPYPDGRPGFYFVRLKYVDNIAEIIAVEKDARKQLVEGQIFLDGSPVSVQHTRLDMGELKHLFDGDQGTLARTDAINPFQLRLAFHEPHAVHQVSLMVGGTATTITLEVRAQSADGLPLEPFTVTRSVDQVSHPREVLLDLPGEVQVTELWFEVFNTIDNPDGHVHLWEVKIR